MCRCKMRKVTEVVLNQLSLAPRIHSKGGIRPRWSGRLCSGCPSGDGLRGETALPWFVAVGLPVFHGSLCFQVNLT